MLRHIFKNKQFLVTVHNPFYLPREGDRIRLGNNYHIITDILSESVIRVRPEDSSLDHLLYVITGIWLILLPIITKCLY